MAAKPDRDIDTPLIPPQPIFAVADRLQEIMDALKAIEPDCLEPEQRIALCAKMLATVQAADRVLDRLRSLQRMELFVSDLAQIVAGCSVKARRKVLDAIEKRFALEHPSE